MAIEKYSTEEIPSSHADPQQPLTLQQAPSQTNQKLTHAPNFDPQPPKLHPPVPSSPLSSQIRPSDHLEETTMT